MPDKNHIIKDISNKTAELIWRELMDIYKQNPDEQPDTSKMDIHLISSVGDGEGDGEGDAKNGKGPTLTEEELQGIKEKCREMLSTAVTYDPNKGRGAGGLAKRFETLLEPKIPWYQELYKYIQNSCPSDFTYNKPHKASDAMQIYMPSLKKESLDVIVHVDTSGSMWGRPLELAMSEVKSICEQFSDVNMNLMISDDCEPEIIRINQAMEVEDIKVLGGGGTSHFPVFEKLENLGHGQKIMICITDGWSDIPSACEAHPPSIPTIFVLTNTYQMDEIAEHGKVILLEENE